MSLALDGSAHANANSSSVGASLTTVNANDVIIAVVTMNGGPLTSVSGGGLTWTNKASVLNTGSNYIELWYAVATGTLGAATITATQTSSAFITIDVFGISGADTSTIWDGTAVTGSTDPLSITTTSVNSFIIGAFREGIASNPTAGSGWTGISGADFQLTEYKIVSSAQSSLSVSQTTGANTANGGIALAVIIAASGGGGVVAKLYNTNFAVKRAAHY